jgi:uncharacterized protein
MWDDFLLFVAVGFAAQMIDGAIGMAYGVASTSVLLSIGIPPAMASACVHAAETFTTAASGFAHWRLKNIDKGLVVRLAIPGMIGGGIGAYVLSNVPGNAVRPFVNAYLLALGCVILWRALNRVGHRPLLPALRVTVLGFFGGLLDAIGGGGWGAMVTTTLLGNGMPARTAIGSVSLAEFFVTSTISATFVMTIGLSHWPIFAGLVAGGVIAAPFAALGAKHLPDRVLMVLVGGVVIVLAGRGLWQWWGAIG